MELQPKPTDERILRAARIIGKPHLFKVCEGCESIVALRAATCPNCEAYRFDSDPGVVVAQARFLSLRERRSVVAEDLC